MGMNTVCLVGRLTRDPEMKYTAGGHAIANVGVAVDRFTKNEQGEYETDFFNCVAWRKSAEFLSEYLGKGRLVSIVGRLQTRSWVEEATGTKRTAVEIVIENVQGLDKRPDQAGGSAPVPKAAKPVPAADMVPTEADPFADE